MEAKEQPAQGELLPVETPPPDWQALAFEAGRVFTPSSPVDEKELFAGRNTQVRRVIDAINQRGQHAIIYGERGVGKTSLAKVLKEFLTGLGREDIIAPRVNCDGNDTFDSAWRKLFEQVELVQVTPRPGFTTVTTTTAYNPTDLITGDAITPDAVRQVLTMMARGFLPIAIFDEFDRLQQKPRRAFADLIKSLSDHAVGATVLLVGVGDTVDQLVEEHQSVGRALVQVPMHRMTRDEITSILDKGLKRLGMTVEDVAKSRVVLLSQGLPHYAHLIALHATRVALDAHSLRLSLNHVNLAILKAVNDAQQSIRNAYNKATTSPRRDNLFAHVLLACALAGVDEMGAFAAQDVRTPMNEITGREYGIPQFAKHLNDFSDKKRGAVLRKTGEKRRYRYRFADPLLQPYVIMQGVVTDRIPPTFWTDRASR